MFALGLVADEGKEGCADLQRDAVFLTLQTVRARDAAAVGDAAAKKAT